MKQVSKDSAVVKPHYCNQASAHDMSSILMNLGSGLVFDSAFAPSKVIKVSTQFAIGCMCAMCSLHD